MLRRLKRIILTLLVAVFFLLVLYLLLAWILGTLSNHADTQVKNDSQPCYDVYVISNDVHLNILLPMQSDAMNWKVYLPQSLAKSDQPMVQIGWGSRAFYTQVPTWSDLTLPVAMQALFYDDAVLYIQPAAIPKADEHHVRRLRMCQHELKQVSLDIKQQLKSNQPLSGFNDFYPAQGHYTPLMTCNEWMRQRLQHRNMPLWSPFDQAVLNHLPL